MRTGKREEIDFLNSAHFLVRRAVRADNTSRRWTNVDDNRQPLVEPPERPVEPLAIFEILVRENADSLTAFLPQASVHEDAAADDLFQETMLVAWRKIGQLRRSRPFGAWLRGIAKRLVLAHWRQGAKEFSVSDQQVLEYLDQRMAQVERQPGDTLDEKIAALRNCLERFAPCTASRLTSITSIAARRSGSRSIWRRRKMPCRRGFSGRGLTSQSALRSKACLQNWTEHVAGT